MDRLPPSPPTAPVDGASPSDVSGNTSTTAGGPLFPLVPADPNTPALPPTSEVAASLLQSVWDALRALQMDGTRSVDLRTFEVETLEEADQARYALLALILSYSRVIETLARPQALFDQRIEQAKLGVQMIKHLETTNADLLKRAIEAKASTAAGLDRSLALIQREAVRVIEQYVVNPKVQRRRIPGPGRPAKATAHVETEGS